MNFVQYVRRLNNQPVTSIKAVTCFVCKKREEAEAQFPLDVLLLDVQGGYGSEFPLDGSKITLPIHGLCLKALLEQNGVDTTALLHESKTQRVTHSETGAELDFWGGWVKPVGSEFSEVDADEPEISEAPHPTALYQHFKGGFYEIISGACYSEEGPMVVYQALQGDSLLWARPLASFLSTVVVEGVVVPRFRRHEAPRPNRRLAGGARVYR